MLVSSRLTWTDCEHAHCPRPDLWADALIPEAFRMASSAFQVDRREIPSDLDQFVRRELGSALAFRYPTSGDHVFGVVVVQDGHNCWRWHHEPCGTMRGTAASVKREIDDIQTPFVLVAHIPGPESGWREVELPDGVIDEELAILNPDWQLRWYAEARTHFHRGTASGWANFHLDDLIDTARTDPDADWFARSVRDILKGHPSRRRHPIRP